MAMSREIPISVHPEFKHGKPRILTRSSSLPNGPKLKLVVENSNPSKDSQEQALKTEHVQTADDSPIQRTNGNNMDKKYKVLKTSLPVDYPQVRHSNEGKPFVRRDPIEEKEQRRHFFRENPFVGDLDKVFEDHYASESTLPVRLGRRNTYSAGSIRETLPSAPKIGKISRRHRKRASFNIPIQVEFDEVKGRKEGEEKGLEEDKALAEEKERKENCLESVQGEEKTNEAVSEVDDKKKSNYNVLKIDKACVVSFDKMKDCDETDVSKDQKVAEKSNSNSSENVDRETYEDEANTEQGQVHTVKDEEPQSAGSLPQESTEENANTTKLLTIESILKKADKLDEEVNAFSDKSKTKAYLALEENLTRLLLELDGIEANRDENIRLARKRAVQQLQRTLTRLERVFCRDVQNSGKEEKDGCFLNRKENVEN